MMLELHCLCVSHHYHVSFGQLDLDRPIEQQGPFDVILHKLTDQIARSQCDDVIAQQQIDRFQVDFDD